MRNRWLAGLLVLLGYVGSPAWALDTCSAKITRSNGVIRVNATGVSGTFQWGTEQGVTPNAFANVCVNGSSARNCEVGAVGTLERITPPASCIMFVADATSECSAYLRGCTPGVRTGTLLTLADIAPGIVKSVSDVDGVPVGTLVYAEGATPHVAFSFSGRTFTAQVWATRFAGMTDFTSLYYENADCTGATYVRYSDRALPVVFIGEDNVAYVADAAGVAGVYPNASFRGETGPCIGGTITDPIVPASAVVDLDDYYTAPFKVD